MGRKRSCETKKKTDEGAESRTKHFKAGWVYCRIARRPETRAQEIQAQQIQPLSSEQWPVELQGFWADIDFKLA
jgi:hypothetical protein